MIMALFIIIIVLKAIKGAFKMLEFFNKTKQRTFHMNIYTRFSRCSPHILETSAL